MSEKPRIGISACLLGEKVRHNGGHKRDLFVTEILSRFVEWVPVCPEVEVGMGVPRETVRLVGNPSHPRVVADRSGKDWSRKMEAYSRKRLKKLSSMNLSGYIQRKTLRAAAWSGSRFMVRAARLYLRAAVFSLRA